MGKAIWCEDIEGAEREDCPGLRMLSKASIGFQSNISVSGDDEELAGVDADDVENKGAARSVGESGGLQGERRGSR